MKVVLNQDVKSLGKKFDIVEVSEGYARNYLIPRKLAVLADNKSTSEAKTKKEAIQHRKDTERENAEKQKEKLEKAVIEFRLKVGEGNKLFGSVTNKEIKEKLKEISNIDIDRKKIELNDAVKTAGMYEANIKLYEGITAKLKIKVVGV
ncbi:MAG: 50S ribosomal protein L9 [Clostridia bacterium]|nr:50S ribosomal protein L9 [Clostridia bacterium]MDD4375196.1 50S ribosomal protein L9 [Clostridia bacterium]